MSAAEECQQGALDCLINRHLLLQIQLSVAVHKRLELLGKCSLSATLKTRRLMTVGLV